MKSIKKFYKEHRVFTILMAIVIVCVVLITTVLIQCFYIGNGSDKYGNRLEGIEKYKIDTAKETDYEKKLNSDKKVKSVDLVVTGKIVYITIQYETGTDLVEAQSIALKSLEFFTKEEQSFYDFNITLKQDSTDKSDGFIISGAKNKNGNGLIWNNNRQTTETTTNSDATQKEE